MVIFQFANCQRLPEGDTFQIMIWGRRSSTNLQPKMPDTPARKSWPKEGHTSPEFSDVEIQQVNFPGIESVSIIQHKLLLIEGCIKMSNNDENFLEGLRNFAHHRTDHCGEDQHKTSSSKIFW